MFIDATLAVLAVFLMITGYFAGALSQLVKIAILIASYLASKWMSPIISDILFQNLGISIPAQEMVSMLGTWLVVYIILSILGRSLTFAVLSSSNTIDSADAVLGALVGLLKTAIFAVLLVFLIGAFKDVIFKHRPQLKEVIAESKVMEVLSKTSLAQEFMPDEVLVLSKLAKGMTDPKKAEKIRKSKQMQKLMRNKMIKQLMDDPQARLQMENGDMMELMKNENFQKAMTDGELLRQLGELGEMNLDFD